MRALRHFPVLAILLLASHICGCSEQRELIPVSGKITLDGKPVTAGTIKFYPVDGGRMTRGGIQPDGSYQLSSFEQGDGTAPGAYKVTIEAMKNQSGQKATPSTEPKVDKFGYGVDERSEAPEQELELLLPKKYLSPEQTPLEATVEESTTNIDFSLPVD